MKDFQFGAAHSLEGIMSRPYSEREMFSLDTKAAFSLQHTAFYLFEEFESIKKIYSDYLTKTFIKWEENVRF